MPCSVALRTDIPGSPYDFTPEDKAAYSDCVKLEAFMTRLQEVHAEGVALLDDLNYGMKYLGLRDVLKDITAMVDDIQKEDIEGVLYPIME